ncbi:hypothetical protein ACFSO0_10345 [Brevibacillus sp. GCM10020057]|uniref:hypothetical protein n=1 Tax=Brevibacillus sp. GCM10020057 TaxID=3317327 RepID=UPI0036257FA4
MEVGEAIRCTGRIVKVFTETGDKDMDWFYDQIMRDKHNNPMSGLKLGNQISFHDAQSARKMLRLHGAWIMNEEEENQLASRAKNQ